MNGTQDTGTNFFDDISCPKHTHGETAPFGTSHFMHPDDVVADLQLTRGEKRETLASWASDVHAVSDAPTLRQLDNGAVVRVTDVLQALQYLDDDQDVEQLRTGRFRPAVGLRLRVPKRLNSVLRRTWSNDDDDDPPPCPATIGRRSGGPLSGGETANPALAMAA